MAVSTYFLSFLIIFAFSNIVISASTCLYTITVQTGTKNDAGTDAKVNLTLRNYDGESLFIPNLEAWGSMPPGHDYFENGNTDVFTGITDCTSYPLCLMKIASDGSGNKAGWYLNYVNVAVAGENSYKEYFSVDQWLAKDEAPYLLYAMRDNCDNYKKKSIRKVKSVAAVDVA